MNSTPVETDKGYCSQPDKGNYDTMICVSIGRTRHKMMIAEHHQLAQNGAELVEYRLDWLSHQPDLSRLFGDRPTPIVATCRRMEDYGRWKGSEDQRQALLRAAIAAEIEYIDLEDDIAGSIPRYGKTKRIVSHHNFNETPDDLEEIHQRMCRLDPDIVKLVTMANKPADMVRMLKLVAAAPVPTVGFCMGEFGMASRILCAKYGSPFTYASFSEDREMAPGQISFKDMKNMYRYDEINSGTKVFAVIGDPIAHSKSPLIHNAAFAHEKLNNIYVPFRIPSDLLLETLRAFEWFQIQGYSITIPHKEECVEYCDFPDETCKTVGAANTWYRDHANRWRASNTDYESALATIRLGLSAGGSTETSLNGKTALILGAGGVSRAIAHGLMKAGCGVTITNRTNKRGEALAKELGCRHTTWENRGAQTADILVNCTPIGMFPYMDETPFQPHWLQDGMLVFDTIYNPENTLLLKDARNHNCKVASGLEMFVRQAALQYERFTQREAPLECMREALRKGISPIN
ncbi:MAG: shikimate dehydrogenase [Planctomycetaceae bacterium]